MEIENSNSSSLNELSLFVSDEVPVKIAYWDKDIICRFVNKACREWFDKSREEMIDKMHLSELLGPLFEETLPYIKEVLLGRQQLFERNIPVPGAKTVRHSLVTYIPHFKNSEVVGFFAQVTDVTYIKDLEKEINSAKRELLRNTILTKEKERRHVVEILHESINQRLAACNMMIAILIKGNPILLNEVQSHILQTINELNSLCQDLTPTEIEIFGIIPAIEVILENNSTRHQKKIHLECKGESLEEIDLNDKLAIFRIVQSFVALVVMSGENKKAKIIIDYNKPEVHIQLLSDIGIYLNVETKEYRTIVSRIEYFAGKLTQTKLSKQNSLDIKFILQ